MFSYLWIRPVLPPGWQNGLGAHWAGMSRRAVTHCGEYRHMQVRPISETAPLLQTLLCVIHCRLCECVACCEHFSSESFRIYQLTLFKDARIRQLLFLYQSHNNQVSSPSTVLIIILARPPPITWTDFFAAFQSQTRERSSCSPSLIVMLLFSLIILLAGVFFDHLQQSSLCFSTPPCPVFSVYQICHLGVSVAQRVHILRQLSNGSLR